MKVEKTYMRSEIQEEFEEEIGIVEKMENMKYF